MLYCKHDLTQSTDDVQSNFEIKLLRLVIFKKYKLYNVLLIDYFSVVEINVIIGMTNQFTVTDHKKLNGCFSCKVYTHCTVITHLMNGKKLNTTVNFMNIKPTM